VEFDVKTKTLAWVERALEESGRLRSGDLFGRGDDMWLGATIDSRSECARRIFFALKGEHADGHRFAEDARSKGSCAAVVEREEVAKNLARSNTPFLLVDDVLVALQELAGAYRGTLDLRVVTVTGSTGKTTTRDYIRLILKKKYKVYSSPGNFNNHIGVPLTLLETDQESEYLVSEIGANHPGEIRFLAQILQPDIGVITNVGDAHIGLFGSREKIAEAKAEMLESIEREGYAVLPRDDEYFDALNENTASRVVTFGYGDSCTFRISSVEDDGDLITFKINEQPLSIKSFGLYNLQNAAAAFAVGDVCGVEAENVREALAEAEPIRGRARIHKANGIVLIDDSYNASPTSMRVSLESLGRIAGKRRVAILGDMAELGSYTDAAHRELGAYITQSPVDRVYWLGENGRHVGDGIGSASKVTVSLFEVLDDLCEAVESEIKPGDVVLVKASRTASLDQVVDRLREGVLKGNSS
jgi:UDP-N-acetylmuramoyl-tripeptide--D-alanyl-D-alanine ligase